MSKLTKACPLFPAPDVAAAAEWYRDRLGFAVRVALDDYAIVERDGLELHLWRCSDRAVAEQTSAYIRVEDVDGMHRHIASASRGGRVSEVQDREWGTREFCVWDPAGNLLRFGEPHTANDSSHKSSADLLDEIAKLPPDELKRQIADAEIAIREGRL